MIERTHEESATRFCEAIKKLANNESALNNFNLYLSIHFDMWLKKYANTPENIAAELEAFAKIED